MKDTKMKSQAKYKDKDQSIKIEAINKQIMNKRNKRVAILKRKYKRPPRDKPKLRIEDNNSVYVDCMIYMRICILRVSHTLAACMQLHQAPDTWHLASRTAKFDQRSTSTWTRGA
jgi:hypothetical protein